MLETPQMARSRRRPSRRELPGVRSSSLRHEDPDPPAPGRPSRSPRSSGCLFSVGRSAGSGRARVGGAVRGACVVPTVNGPSRIELNWRRPGHQPGRGRPAGHRPRSSLHGTAAEKPRSHWQLLFLRGDDDGGRVQGHHRAGVGRLPGGLHQPPSLELFGCGGRVDDSPLGHRRAGPVELPSRWRIDLLRGDPLPRGRQLRSRAPNGTRLHESCDRGGRSQRGCAPRSRTDERG